MTTVGPDPAGGAAVAEVRWTDGRGAPAVRERRFELERGGRSVPGLLWTPDEPAGGPWPLVLLGHGGSGSKREDYILAMAYRLVRRHGIAAAAIDGPVHGDRRANRSSPPFLVMAEFAQLWAADGEAMTDAMVADWRATLDALVDLPDVADGPVGWWGLSMGTILGLPVVAAEPRISVAVLGLMGLTGPTRSRIERDAPAVTCSVLFLAQLHDELFPVADALALFEALGSTDKRLHAHPGGHGTLPGEEFSGSADFLAGRLRGYVAGD
jgi:dienelactone hydrolase